MAKHPAKAAVKCAATDKRSGVFDWHDVVDGTTLNSDVTILFFSTDAVGKGPSWHVHPYDEIFIIKRGRARFKVGDEIIDAEEGDIVMGPAAVPHKYENLGPGPLESIDIHLSRSWVQTDLEDPDLK
ncbi:cupin domain-containing protein [Sulfitobacter albidus]|uniref:Cupin domain-containing protein n=1 Tax=Sulfitobacter albidus TaxID=2829501 RepID=A0A975JBJ2_9RHOB|nr:cupin domain-containing protein [Sulfitobacter albidus]QUJ75251.1 cupin domain-containing protein [Sulfitobacter albidus]